MFWFPNADKRQGGWQGQGSTVAWLVHSSPLHPTLRNSTDTVSGRAESNNKISLLHSLLALSLKGWFNASLHPHIYIQIRERMWIVITALPPLHLLSCLWLSASFLLPLSLKNCGDVRLEKPLGSPWAVTAMEPPLNWTWMINQSATLPCNIQVCGDSSREIILF